MQCQVCHTKNVSMYSTCPQCHWTNDGFLADKTSAFEVDFRLSYFEKHCWSQLNQATPMEWLNKS